MSEHALVDNLVYCKPFATKLASQGYGYMFESADLKYIDLIEPIYTYFFATEEKIKDTPLLPEAG